METEAEKLRRAIEKSLAIMETEEPLSKIWRKAETSYLGHTMFREKILNDEEIAEYDARYLSAENTFLRNQRNQELNYEIAV